ncbi:hypothetical protein BU24DRAFT_367130 [Aaosphaeria arxii CBS 175.79]|uniref:UBA domain-containing protein n=1 Tax=Aaosphaeria arxii CBS 175.79 TaxID=1450172 RepID=A0A6A5XYL5_9PLEO|nr:uncharacterized protein BU24DRAFT_367130 [Aaosphaeria arxii CBS 175.79]KAF2017364.1 hypothetical protein BU24DRAFT_367130 [Aaosphaeria arxii CBS 175.79]
MAVTESGFFEYPFSRTRSLFRSQSTQAKPSPHRRDRSLQPSSLKSFDTQSRATSQSSKHPGSTSSLSPRSLSSPKKQTKRGIKHTRKTTIIRAVPPGSSSITTSLSTLERDMATLPNEEILSAISGSGWQSPATSRSSPSSLRHATSPRLGARSRSSPTLCSIKAGTEMNFSDQKSNATGYEQDKFQWESSRSNSSLQERRASSALRSRRPQIQVVIPQHQKDRPLPTSPFFSNPSNTLSRSASAEPLSVTDISPPSGSKRPLARNSAVSPLSAQQKQNINAPHPSIDATIVKSQIDTTGQTTAGPPTNSSSEDSHGDDCSSTYSRRSSRSSVGEQTSPMNLKPINFHDRSASVTFSIKSPLETGVFVDVESVVTKSENSKAETGLSVAAPTIPPPRKYAPHGPIEDDFAFKPTCTLQPSRNRSATTQLPLERRPTLTRKATIIRRPSVRRQSSQRRSSRISLMISPTMGVLDHAIIRQEVADPTQLFASPTLSEAEFDLEEELLSTRVGANPFAYDDTEHESISIIPGTPPTVPRKSSKRQSLLAANFRLSRVSNEHILSQLRRTSSRAKARGLRIEIPRTPSPVADDFYLSPIPVPPKALKRTITPSVAENVIYGIFEQLDNFEDLFATAVVNGGFYRVFKRFELDLMKNTLWKMSPPAWEHREICYPGHDQHQPEDLEKTQSRMEYTPNVYIEHHKSDVEIITTLKTLIGQRFQTFLRTEIANTLFSQDGKEQARIDNALWRIWTFCKIFGCGKGREDDIVAQMDWLKGGPLVHQDAPTHAIFSTDALDMNDTLANAPECFALGNEGGLSAEELFDMMELWNCLGLLLQPICNRRVQARQYGVFDDTEVRGGDIDGEELMLDEWYYYLLTLGLSPILELVGPCHESEASAFIVAQKNNWTHWKAPLQGSSRRNFFKEAAERVYENKIAADYAEPSSKEVQRQISKQRLQGHITELQQRRNNGERLPEIRMSQERPMSGWEGVMNNLTRQRPAPSSNLVSHIPSIRSSALVLNISSSVADAHASNSQERRPRSFHRVVAQPLLPTPPPSTVPSVADRSSTFSSMPPIEEHPAFRRRHESIPEMPSLELHPAFLQHRRQAASSSHESASRSTSPSKASIEDQPAFKQHPLQRNILDGDASENSAEKAVYRIVEMGFTPDQARSALRRTDMGDGLRVDRAVELLLSGY